MNVLLIVAGVYFGLIYAFGMEAHADIFYDIPQEVQRRQLFAHLHTRPLRLSQMELLATRRALVAMSLFLLRSSLTAPFTELDTPFDSAFVGIAVARPLLLMSCSGRLADPKTGARELRNCLRFSGPPRYVHLLLDGQLWQHTCARTGSQRRNKHGGLCPGVQSAQL
jgi:hypothetical protein